MMDALFDLVAPLGPPWDFVATIWIIAAAEAVAIVLVSIMLAACRK